MINPAECKGKRRTRPEPHHLAQATPAFSPSLTSSGRLCEIILSTSSTALSHTRLPTSPSLVWTPNVRGIIFPLEFRFGSGPARPPWRDRGKGMTRWTQAQGIPLPRSRAVPRGWAGSSSTLHPTPCLARTGHGQGWREGVPGGPCLEPLTSTGSPTASRILHSCAHRSANHHLPAGSGGHPPAILLASPGL